MSFPKPREVFFSLVNGVANAVVTGDTAELPLLYSDTTDVRHPMYPGGSESLRTRADVAAHLGVAEPGYTPTLRYQAEAITVHETADPEVIVAEFEYRGTVVATGKRFVVPCVFVMRVRDGLIVESRDYIDHAAFAHARNSLDELLSVLRPANDAD